MRVERQPAFVLHERPYRETSLLLEVLTRDHGRVGLVARGVRVARPRLGRGVLKPLVALELSWQGRGELVTLTGADPVGVPIVLADEALICALYVNELLTRLLPRNDAQPEVFGRYAACLLDLAAADSLAWVLRRFERDLLALLGYALMLDVDGESRQALDPAATYSYDPERGPIAWALRPLNPSVSGAALLALAGDRMPNDTQLRDLKRLMRSVLRHQLGGRELNAWHMLHMRDPKPDLKAPAAPVAEAE